MPLQRILFTGPSGRIGTPVVPLLRAKFEVATFDLHADPSDTLAFEGDLQSIEVLESAMQGCAAVVHMAATSDEAPFHDQLLPNNIVGTYNVLEAARKASVPRVVFASSIQAIGRGMEENVPYTADILPRPSTVYGATKVWAETLGRWFFDRHQIEFVAIRIGAFQDYDSDWLKEGKAKDIWLSPRDMAQLITRAVETPNVGYAIVHGTSRVPCEKMSLSEARDILGYEPQDNADDYYQK
jgi:uronate dehydrogenase